MLLFDFDVVYWFCCYDKLRWEAATRTTDAIARASESLTDSHALSQWREKAVMHHACPVALSRDTLFNSALRFIRATTLSAIVWKGVRARSSPLHILPVVRGPPC